MGVLAAAIQRRFEAAKVVPEGSVVRAEVPIDGSLYLARVALMPSTRVSVQVPHTDGFELSLAWTDRRSSAPLPRRESRLHSRMKREYAG